MLVGTLLLGPWIRQTARKHVRLLVVPHDPEVLARVTELCAERQIRAVIDRCYPLEEAREALRSVCEGRQKGKVVITFEDQRPGDRVVP